MKFDDESAALVSDLANLVWFLAFQWSSGAKSPEEVEAESGDFMASFYRVGVALRDTGYPVPDVDDVIQRDYRFPRADGPTKVRRGKLHPHVKLDDGETCGMIERMLEELSYDFSTHVEGGWRGYEGQLEIILLMAEVLSSSELAELPEDFLELRGKLARASPALRDRLSSIVPAT